MNFFDDDYVTDEERPNRFWEFIKLVVFVAFWLVFVVCAAVGALSIVAYLWLAYWA